MDQRRTGYLEQYNASAPAFLDIDEKEAAKHRGHAEDGTEKQTPHAYPGGAEGGHDEVKPAAEKAGQKQ